MYKSGFDPPGDVEFDDYSASMRRSISESSYLDNRTEGRRHSRKLWPFIRKNKVHTHLAGTIAHDRHRYLTDLHTHGRYTHLTGAHTCNSQLGVLTSHSLSLQLLTLLSSPRQPPPPPPTSPSPGGVANSPQSPPPASREPITQRLNDLMTSGSRTRKQCMRSLKRGVHTFV